MNAADNVGVYKLADRLIHQLMPGSFIGVQIGKKMMIGDYFFQRAYSALYKDEQEELMKLLNDMVEVLNAVQSAQYKLKVELVQELDPAPDPDYQFWVHLHDEFSGRSFQFIPTVEYVRQQIAGDNFEVYVGPRNVPFLGDAKLLWPNRVVHNWRSNVVLLLAQDREMVVTPRIVLFEPPAHLEASGIWIGVRDRIHAEKTIGFFRAIMRGFIGRRTSPVVCQIEQLLKTGHERWAAARPEEQRARQEIFADLRALLGQEFGSR